jgi:hypothetical protein
MNTTSAPEKLRRKRGEARVWPRGRIWWIQYYSNGIQHRESSHSEKQADAERLPLEASRRNRCRYTQSSATSEKLARIN